jgi:hypothetical protein
MILGGGTLQNGQSHWMNHEPRTASNEGLEFPLFAALLLCCFADGYRILIKDLSRDI